MKKNQSGRIASIRAAGSLTGRLMAMGLLPGAKVQVLGVAPLGDPMLVQLEGCRMSLRRSEAESLTIEE
ncbi:ferrous iron transport protein A [Planctomycetales bacterium ZRK34]|nr:ferrous iron transport protein A [Planctomycetales bacterium ZRK34]